MKFPTMLCFDHLDGQVIISWQMAAQSTSWEVTDKTRLLIAMMDALAGDALISFEGDLGHLRLSAIPSSSIQETAALKRQTLWPRQDFVTVQLEPTTVKAVLSAIGGNVPRKIRHIQIAKAGAIEFAAYDNFHPGCTVFGRGVAPDLIESLVSQGLLRPCADRSE